MTRICWTERELAEHFPDLRPEGGVDLDGDGAIAGPETTDRNGDGDVSAEEWKTFLGDNADALKALGGFFPTYYAHGTSLSVDNPIHDILQVESKATTESETADVYGAVSRLLKEYERFKITGGTPASLASIRMQMLYNALWSTGFRNGVTYESMLTTAVADKMVDCDSSAYLVMGAAHELGWPLGVVPAPEHLFLRYDDGKGIRFNIDMGRIKSDRYYIDLFGIDIRAVKKGVFLKTLGRSYIVSNALTNRASHWHRKRGDSAKALKDNEEALHSAPENTVALFNSICNLTDIAGESLWLQEIMEDLASRLQRPGPKPRMTPDEVETLYEEALARIKRLEQLEYRKVSTASLRSRIHIAKGKLDLALAECKRGLDTDEIADYISMRKAYIHMRIAHIMSKRKEREKAMTHAEQAIATSKDDDETLAAAYNTRGDIQMNAGMYDAAMKDYDEAARLGPHNSSIRFARAGALYRLERFDEAIADMQHAIELSPSIREELRECIGMIEELKERKRWREKDMKRPHHNAVHLRFNL
ncbi:MAG: hypothetical protein JXA24_04845 [Proteobacteria bacterium]|nr:hypothetical protein [Pseudomonadota bacterium]